MPSSRTETGMGFDFGLEDDMTCFHLKFRWLFEIEGVASQAEALPPSRAARPSFSYKESEIQHVTETVFYPSKPEWKPINLTLYDIRSNKNPVFAWLKEAYDSQKAEWLPVEDTESETSSNATFKREGKLCLYDGCGNIVEEWTFDNCYPQAINWGDLDMASSDVVMVDVTLRYDRAYFKDSNMGGGSPGNNRSSPQNNAGGGGSSAGGGNGSAGSGATIITGPPVIIGGILSCPSGSTYSPSLGGCVVRN